MENIEYFKSIEDIKIVDNSMTVNIPTNVRSDHDLFSLFSKELNFPDYFGDNWDALFDCLKDLSFVKEKNITIINNDIPFKNSIYDRKTYIELLVDLINHWKEHYQHKIFIYFPEDCRKFVEEIINEYNKKWSTQE